MLLRSILSSRYVLLITFSLSCLAARAHTSFASSLMRIEGEMATIIITNAEHLSTQITYKINATNLPVIMKVWFLCTLKSKLRSSCNVDFEVWWIHVQCMHFAAANSVCKSNEMFIIHNTNTNINDLTWLPVILLLLFRLLNVRKSTKQKLLAVSFSAFELSIAWVTLHAPHEFRKISPIFHFRCMCVCVCICMDFGWQRSSMTQHIIDHFVLGNVVNRFWDMTAIIN